LFNNPVGCLTVLRFLGQESYKPRFYFLFNESCSETEVSKQRHYSTDGRSLDTAPSPRSPREAARLWLITWVVIKNAPFFYDETHERA
jgi:hypothetical protein